MASEAASLPQRPKCDRRSGALSEIYYISSFELTCELEIYSSLCNLRTATLCRSAVACSYVGERAFWLNGNCGHCIATDMFFMS